MYRTNIDELCHAYEEPVGCAGFLYSDESRYDDMTPETSYRRKHPRLITDEEIDEMNAAIERDIEAFGNPWEDEPFDQTKQAC